MELYKKYGDGMVYVVLTAISFVFIDDLGDYINPFISLLCMAIIATVWFNLVNLKCLTNIYRLCIKNYKIYLMVTLLISINWLASITAPHYSDPFIYLSVYFMVLAICGFIARYFETKLNNNLLSSASLILIIIFMCFSYVIKNEKNLTLGIILGCTGGISAYFYAVYSRKLINACNFTSSQVLAVRFIPLCMLLLIFIKYNGLSIHLKINDIGELLLMGVISLILPVYFYQQAIKKMGAANSSVIVAITPAIVFLLYAYHHKILQMNNLLITVLVVSGLILPNIFLKGNK